MTDAGTNLSSDQLRRMVVAALSNPRMRRVLAEIIDAGDPPITSDERREGRRLLRRFGMLTPGEQLDERFLLDLAEGSPPAEHAGAVRYLRAHDGRIDHYPDDPAERRELLSWIAERILGSDQIMDEKPLTRLLFAFTNDPNTLRRALVDSGLLVRNPDGTDYRRAAD
jgi:hypothetical protein